MEDVKQVIVLRKDLGMRAGKMVAQGCHASLNCVRMIQESKSFKLKGCLSQWEKSGQTKVVCRVESLDELYELARKAEEHDIPYKIITDAGRTEFNGVPTITCIGFGPYLSDKIDLVTKDLKLL